MRTKILASVALMGAAAFCSPAFAGDSALAPSDEVIPIVAPGEQIGVACEALQVAQQNSDVRVVLTVSVKPGEKSPGYGKVLATDQQVSNGGVRVKVPNLPNIADHTYDLTVYVMAPSGAQAQTCDAGHVKVTQRMSALLPLQHSGGKHA